MEKEVEGGYNPSGPGLLRDMVRMRVADCLESGDLECALDYYVASIRERERKTFQYLDQEGLSELADLLREGELIEEKNNLAFYKVNMFSEEVNDYIDVTFEMYLDDDGIWRIISF